MVIKIDNVNIAVMPAQYSCKLEDIDDEESSGRSANGTMIRDRIATKRVINMSWNVLKWSDCSALLTQFMPQFVSVNFPDPQKGSNQTATFYVNSRPAAVSILKGSDILWDGIELQLTER